MTRLALGDRFATFSPCERYRYTLTIRWGTGELLVWLCLNPSVADHARDDPSVRKMCGFARRWGYAGIVVLNIFAWRDTDPRGLTIARAAGRDIVGAENDAAILRVMAGADVVAGWGANGDYFPERVAEVRAMLARLPAGRVTCLGRTAGRQPKHPLMPAYTTPREAW